MVENARNKLRELLVLSIAVDCKRVRRDGCMNLKGSLVSKLPEEKLLGSLKIKRVTFRSREVNDIPIALKHVNLLDRLDRLHIHLLQRALELLIICARALVDFLDLSPRGTFAAVNLVISNYVRLYDRRRGVWVRSGGAYPAIEC